MMHINGRNPLTKSGYIEVGKSVNSTKKHTDFQWLPNTGYPEEELLLPQRTIVQFNSTYMELTGRHDRIKGDATAWMFAFLAFLGYAMYVALYMMSGEIEQQIISSLLFYVPVLLIIIASILFVVGNLRREIFTYTYFPIRFNRKTQKVYVRQANKKVEVFNWNELKFYTSDSTPSNQDGADIKAVVLANDGVTVTKIFSLPYFSMLSSYEYVGCSTQFKQHFEFVRRYMEAETEEQLTEVRNAIRYTHPVHKKRETPYISFQRVVLNAHYSFLNMENPKESLVLNWHNVIKIILLWFMYIGRLIAINTSITPRFSKEIEAECLIDPDDKFDLDKYPPIGNLESKPKLKHKILLTIAFIINSIVMILGMALFVDIIGYGKGVEHDSYFIALLNILTLQWL